MRYLPMRPIAPLFAIAALIFAAAGSASLAHAAEVDAGSTSSGMTVTPRTAYLGLQVPVSTALYGIALPWALDAGGVKTRIATPLIVAPFAFGAHLWIARSFDFNRAHQAGTSYLSMASIYAGFALPAALIDDTEIGVRTAAWTAMALYPAGVYGGYLLGEHYDAERIATQSQYAMGFGMLGFFTPLLYFEDFSDNQEAMWRIGLVQSVGMAGMGHFISRYRQTGSEQASGVSLGLTNHTLLGMAGGLTVAAYANARSVRPWAGGAVAGGTLGFMEGLWFYHNNRDSHERSLYTGLGIAAGAVAGAGFTLLFWDEDGSGYSQRVMTASFLGGGAFLGYVATYFLTQGMQDMAATEMKSPAGRLAKRWTEHKNRYAGHVANTDWSWRVEPFPLVLPAGATGQEWRYAIPGFIARF